MKIRTSLLAAIAAAFLGAGCTTTEPHRTAHTPGGASCEPDADGRVARSCDRQIFERAPDGTELHFVEFDDQGWIAGRDPRDDSNAAHRQLDLVTERLRGLARDACSRPVSLAVYVHGWKHDARGEDGNVAAFRRILQGLSRIERDGGRQVVGIYVAWRGGSTPLPEPIKSLTFWNRKDAVERMAQGTVRELFARVTALADIANETWVQGDAPCSPVKPVRTLLIGHSFGGHALVTATSNLLLRNLVTLQERALAESPLALASGTARVEQAARLARRVELQREGDLIVLVNPAIEGTRYEPLHRVAQQPVRREPGYMPPLLVSFTSVADPATRVLFPAGRGLGTLFERYGAFVEPEEREANLRTLGHNDRYVTHVIRPAPAASAACAGWTKELPLDEQIARETLQNEAFFAAAASDPDAAAARRELCPAWELVHVGREGLSPHAPVMNIQVPAALIPDHSTITGQAFIVVVRQLYLDSSRQLRVRELQRAGRLR